MKRLFVLLALLGLSLAAPVSVRAETHTVQLRILEKANPAPHVAVVIVFPSATTTIGTRLDLETDAQGFVTFIVPGEVFWLTVHSLNSTVLGRRFVIPLEALGPVRFGVRPKEWKPTASPLADVLSLGDNVSTQPQTTTFSIDCWSGGHCAMPCGGSGNGNYSCSDGTGTWSPTCAYDDPLPQGSTVMAISAVLFTHQCSTSTSLMATLNGQLIGNVTESRSSCSCLMSSCLDTHIQSASFPQGFPGYISGGRNTFGILIQSGLLCVEHVELTLQYTGSPVQIVQPTSNQDFNLGPSDFTATDPITFEAQLNPPGAANSIAWTVLLEYQTSGGRGASQDSKAFQSQPGGTHDESYTSMGGRMTINASAVLNGQTMNASPVQATITGVPLADGLITNRLASLYATGATPHLMTGIASHESTYRQFAQTTLYGRSDLWPTESFDGGSHIGLMQVAVTTAAAWNWETNTQLGVDLFRDKLQAANRLQQRIIKANPGLRKLTKVELENMALVLYGPDASGDLGKQYYVPAPAQGGSLTWAVNNAGNAGGVAYADDCRSKIK